MTIGPEPMTKIFLRSDRLGIFDALPTGERCLHESDELSEQIAGVMRAGCRFGVILHAEDRPLALAKAFDGLIIQIEMRQLELLGQLRDGEAVVVRRDLDFAREEVLDGLVRSAVSELQFVRARAQGQTQNLMPQTDPEDG
jgi:hypothetical protein